MCKIFQYLLKSNVSIILPPFYLIKFFEFQNQILFKTKVSNVVKGYIENVALMQTSIDLLFVRWKGNLEPYLISPETCSKQKQKRISSCCTPTSRPTTQDLPAPLPLTSICKCVCSVAHIFFRRRLRHRIRCQSLHQTLQTSSSSSFPVKKMRKNAWPY